MKQLKSSTKNMKNPYNDLRQETQSILGDKWDKYPDVTDFTTCTIFNSKTECVQLRIATQDEITVIACSITENGITRSFIPNRKWGQFRSEKDARLWALGFALERLQNLSADALNEIHKEINKTQQLSLF